MSVETLLDARALTKRFDGFTAVDAVDVSISQGAIHSVIGPNGAGKTTFFRLLTGIQRPTSGSVTFGDQDITGRRPHVIARRGLTQSFQITNIFPRLSVLESVQIAILARRKRCGDFLTVFQRRVESEARELLEQVGLEDLAGVEARTLSHGDQRILEMTLALATHPRLLLLDEPTAGMSPLETERMVELVTQLARAKGLTVLLSEHDMDVVFGISDQVTVLHQGRVISEGPPEQVQDDERVVEVYLGGEG
ncbi:MAG TPA: ABC transporter ATP-binding protein [Solirubrobacteraceae bacterium]|jgi:branched-chain amino acid transport system ATP-binding protein|nr:ABC transporter ATP-binding protein [Solirubrobacteraceae bacterium]